MEKKLNCDSQRAVFLLHKAENSGIINAVNLKEKII